MVAEHADLWNIPGPPHNSVDYLRERSRVLDRQCAAVGRDPARINRSTQLIVSYQDPASTRTAVQQVIELGITHIVLNLYMPFPHGVARWLADEIIGPALDQVRGHPAVRPAQAGP